MREVRDKSWSRRGLSLLWGAEALARLAQPSEVVSIRALFALARTWPSELPSSAGKTLFVAGLEGVVDSLAADDAERWLEEDLKPRVLSFQEEYEGQAGLVLWLPAGRQRVHMKRATEKYLWHSAPSETRKTLPIGQILWGGSEADAGRILDEREANQDVDGPAWIGLHHPRIS